jgi:hypothetical protein
VKRHKWMQVDHEQAIGKKVKEKGVKRELIKFE